VRNLRFTIYDLPASRITFHVSRITEYAMRNTLYPWQTVLRIAYYVLRKSDFNAA